MKRTSANKPVTKRDLENMFDIFGQLVFARFDLIDEELAKKADKAYVAQLLADKADKGDIARIENKLDPTIDQVVEHEMRLKKLEPKAA